MPVEFELIPGRKIGKDNPCFIIAEVGQNHQGNIELAKELITVAKECGADCVKFQKSDLTRKFNRAALERPYNTEHSFGATYGEHKTRLEFNHDEFRILKKYADDVGIIFSASAMDESSVDFLYELGVPFFKVGSGDANNFPYLIHIAKKGKPLIISSGMQEMDTMNQVYNTVKPFNDHFCFLQCTSSYPVNPEDVHLRVISTYQKEFPDIPIGFSGHETGIGISLAAVALGAKVLERHITLDKNSKGTDHCASLEPEEFKQLVGQVRSVERALGMPTKRRLACELPCYLKLGKSVVASRDLKSGTRLTRDMVLVKVAEPSGWPAGRLADLLGCVLTKDVSADESILECAVIRTDS